MNNHKITLKDIANEVGVSTSLVSFVMNNKGGKYRVSEEMSRKILETATKLNYQPNNAARSLRMGRSATIGVIVSDISNKFFADIARCIEDDAYKRNYTVIFGSTDESATKLENLMEVLINKGVDGMIIVPCEGSERAIMRVATKGIPIVLLDRRIENEQITSVVLNNKRAASMAVDLLVEEGFKRIEMISYDLNLSNISEREQGYISAMEANGLGYGINIHRVKYKDMATQTHNVIKGIAFRDRDVDAVIFATNSLALCGLKSLSEFNLTVPKDVAVISFDASEAFDLLYTSVTYIKQPIEMFALESLELLVKSIEHNDSRYTAVSLNPEIVFGHSSKKVVADPDEKQVEPVSALHN